MTKILHMDDLLGSATALDLSPSGQDTETVRRVSELKKELRKLVNFITDEDECRIGLFDQISNTLAALKDIKFKKRTDSGNEGNGSASTSQSLNNIVVPEHFLCPISSQLMRDPIILATGEVSIIFYSYSTLRFVQIQFHGSPKHLWLTSSELGYSYNKMHFV